MVPIIPCGSVVRNEVGTIQKIAQHLDGWEDCVLLTNIGGLNAKLREIDALLITYNSVVCIEIKNWEGIVTASINDAWSSQSRWGDLELKMRYPLRQAKNASVALKTFLINEKALPDKIFWFSYVVVLGHQDCRLTYNSTEAEQLKYQAFHVNDFAERIEMHWNAHGDEISRSKLCTSYDIELILHKLGVFPERYSDYIRSLKIKPSINNFANQRPLPKSTAEQSSDIIGARQQRSARFEVDHHTTEAERARQQVEAERQAEAERAQRQQVEAERQAEAERTRRQQVEAERQAEAERTRRQQVEAERQAEAERTQRQQIEAIRNAQAERVQEIRKHVTPEAVQASDIHKQSELEKIESVLAKAIRQNNEYIEKIMRTLKILLEEPCSKYIEINSDQVRDISNEIARNPFSAQKIIEELIERLDQKKPQEIIKNERVIEMIETEAFGYISTLGQTNTTKLVRECEQNPGETRTYLAHLLNHYTGTKKEVQLPIYVLDTIGHEFSVNNLPERMHQVDLLLSPRASAEASTRAMLRLDSERRTKLKFIIEARIERFYNIKGYFFSKRHMCLTHLSSRLDMLGAIINRDSGG